MPNEILFTLAGVAVPAGTVYYWIGTGFLGFVIIAGCNAANLIDGLDGLLTGSATIMSIGFLAMGLLVASTLAIDNPSSSLVGVRVALALALLGTTLGFLPWNFNPAVIFLGDCGSLLIGYLCVTIVLLFGEDGPPSLVVAGFIVFGLPITDTTLAIIRRKVAGVPLNTPDAQHIHHQIKRLFGSVRKAVCALYLITTAFSAIGVAMTAVLLLTETRVLVMYAVGAAFFGILVAVAVKIALIQRWIEQTLEERARKGQVDASPDLTVLQPDKSDQLV
jgi:UDP-GlcNAc:undecaprenyl-phosphate GlcNAc-1-phosphate transferase